MVKKLKILLVDDHPIIIDSYKNVLKRLEEESTEFEFLTRTATDCETANFEVEKAVHGRPFDLVFLDIRIPPSKDKKLLSGEDLGVKIKSLFKNVKIMVFTSYDDNYRLNSILKTLNPDGFIIKSDVSMRSLMEAIFAVIYDPPYYSKSIIKLMRQHIVNDIPIDLLDRKLLYYLSEGYKTKELITLLHLTRGAIDKRKKKLMDSFEVEDHLESSLLYVAKDKGFI